MNIVYSSSDSYAPIAGVSIMSLLHNNTDADEINIYMIDNNISDENKKRFENLVDKIRQKYCFLSPVPTSTKMAGVDIESRKMEHQHIFSDCFSARYCLIILTAVFILTVTRLCVTPLREFLGKQIWKIRLLRQLTIAEVTVIKPN